MERSETMKIMDQLEALLLKQGWPVPFSPYYLVRHDRMLSLLDQLRASLQDEMDARFIKAFASKEADEKIKEEKKIGIGKDR